MTPIFLPVSLYKVKFKVAAGRPFSRFERLVLKAISAGTIHLDDLVKVFCIHRRMVVESLVTLMQAGWVSIESQTNQFGLTPSGLDACKTEHALPPLVYTEDRWQIVVMERVAGQLARGDKVRAETKKSLSKVWQLGARIPKADISNSVDPGMVRPLLSGRSGERIRWVGPISAASDSNAFVVVGVDTKSEKIIGIPKSWQALLFGDLLDRARKRERQLAEDGLNIDTSDLQELIDTDASELDDGTGAYNIHLEEEDVAVGKSKNRSIVSRFLDESESFVAIASSTLSNDEVNVFRPAIEAALVKGKSIFVCWGATPGSDDPLEHKKALKLLEKLQWDSRRASSGGRLTVAASEGQFQANVLIGDVGGYVEAAVGSHSWLGQDDKSRGISVRLRHPGPVARLCDVIGDYHASDQRLKRAGGLTRLRNAALDLSALAEDSGRGLATGVAASLIFDGHNGIECERLLSTARESIRINGERFQEDVATEHLRLISSAIRAGRKAEIYLRDQNGASLRDALAGISGDSDLSRLTVQGPIDIPANCIIVDSTTVFISSYRFLGPLRSGHCPFGSEIGVSLSGSSVPSWLSDELDPLGLP